MSRIVVIFIIFIFNLSCQRESKSKEYIIENEISYPMSQNQVIEKIGLPDSISTEDYDTGSFGIRKREIYHYGRHQLIFSSQGVYKGLKFN